MRIHVSVSLCALCVWVLAARSWAKNRSLGHSASEMTIGQRRSFKRNFLTFSPNAFLTAFCLLHVAKFATRSELRGVDSCITTDAPA